jgi:hypothetical protein
MAQQTTFKYMTLEEIAKLKVYPEPGVAAVTGGIKADLVGDASGPGYAYFIAEGGGTNYFKVGRTVNPEERLGNLQTGNPRRLDMNAQHVNNMLATEQQLKAAMAGRYPRGDGGTEWFLAPPGGLGEAQDLFMEIVNRNR